MVDKVSVPIGDEGNTPSPEKQAQLDEIQKNIEAEGTEGGEQTPAAPVRPDYVPEKFWDAEKGEVRLDDLMQSYSSLERKMSEGEKPAGTEQPKGEEGADGEVETPTSFEEALKEFSNEYTQNGQLSDESYEKLQKDHNFDRKMVDTYIRGQVALQQEYDSSLLETVGGSNETWESMINWATENLPEGEKAAFRAAINSGELETAKLAAQGLYSKFSSNASVPPSRRVGANNTTPGSSDTYETFSEMLADQQRPEYKTDPNFRRKVAEKVARSKNLS